MSSKVIIFRKQVIDFVESRKSRYGNCRQKSSLVIIFAPNALILLHSACRQKSSYFLYGYSLPAPASTPNITPRRPPRNPREPAGRRQRRHVWKRRPAVTPARSSASRCAFWIAASLSLLAMTGWRERGAGFRHAMARGGGRRNASATPSLRGAAATRQTRGRGCRRQDTPVWVLRWGRAGAEIIAMDAVARPALVLAALLALAGCGLTPDPPPDFPPSAFGGTGTEMAKCMKYASEGLLPAPDLGRRRQRARPVRLSSLPHRRGRRQCRTR